MNAKNTAYQITGRRRSYITTDRQYGSGGREVGRILSQKLGISFHDGGLLLLVAERSGLNPGRLREKDETRSKNPLHGIVIFAESLQNYGQMFESYQMFEAVSETIHRLVVGGPAIFMGWCADTVLKEMCASLDILIYASSMEERVSRIRATDHVPAKNTEAYIGKKNQQRREYYKVFAEKEWGKMENHDICLNVSSFGYEGCADTITTMADHAGNDRREE